MNVNFRLIHQKILEKLPKELHNLVPRKFQIIGDIAILKLPNQLEDYKYEIANIIYQNCKFKSIVLLKGIEGEERKPKIELLIGKETKTIHEEAGVKYVVDVAKVMFSRLNKKERERMAKIGNRFEIVIDMFAGIGYFSLPISKNVKRVYSIEINYEAVELLLEAIKLNNINNIIPILSDNRKVSLENIADRVIMGYLFETENFIHKAYEFSKSEAIIHFHRIFDRKLKKEEIALLVKSWFLKYFHKVEILNIIRVKNYSPGKIHYVVDLKCKK